MSTTSRHLYQFAILFIDLDRFKVINDSLGHLVGDQLLIEISHRLASCVRVGDTVARFGGDEFTILLDEISDISTAQQLAERIQKTIAAPFNLDGQEIFVTASIGITSDTTECDKPETLLRDADTAMYQAKIQGKARYEVFNTDMHTHAMARLNLETDLRRAIKNQEFVVHYQPIISLSSGSVVRLEALVRWDHPVRGLIQPLEFIPLAEETGMILNIGEWVLRTVCAQSTTWQNAGLPPFSMAVNFSAKQFQHQNLPQMIVSVPPTHLAQAEGVC